MQAFGILLISAAAWFIYCGAVSIRPVAVLNAAIKKPAQIGTIIQGAKGAAVASRFEDSGGSFAVNEGSTVAPPTPTAPITQAGSPQAYAQSLGTTKYLWGIDQFVYLNQLWTRESGWNYQAKNPSSGAYGIPQALPASKMLSAGPDYLTNYQTQVKWGLGYIASRYGTPKAAWDHETKFGWY